MTIANPHFTNSSSQCSRRPAPAQLNEEKTYSSVVVAYFNSADYSDIEALLAKYESELELGNLKAAAAITKRFPNTINQKLIKEWLQPTAVRAP